MTTSEFTARDTHPVAADLEQPVISRLAVKLVPERLARRYLVLPLSIDNRTLTYATFQPFDGEAERDLGFASGRDAIGVPGTRAAILAGLDRFYPAVVEARPTGELERLAGGFSSEEVMASLVAPAAAGVSPVIDLCNHLIEHAVDAGASDIQIDCASDRATVRFRICGVLEPMLTLPASASRRLLNRFKIMAQADIALKFRPQDGAFSVAVHDRRIDVRLSTLPTAGGEKIVMRVIDSQAPLHALDELGYDAGTLARLCASLSKPDGLMLVTGPTGSGKTTTLYAALAHLRTGETHIISVEDPVERNIAGVTQIPVNARAGTTLPGILRSMLRQDPNVIMVSEIRDEEVARIVGQAAYTGHLVLSSLRTADAASAITRLMDLGLEPFKIAESLTAVLAQRLVRRLCAHCRRTHDDIHARTLGVANGVRSIPSSAGAGCAACRYTGYSGRLAVAELLTPSEELRAAIARGATAHEIRTTMRAARMPSMRQQALALVAEGTTSLEEMDRVLGAEEGKLPKKTVGRRVLIAEDDPIARMLVKLLLEKDDYEVLEATTGAEAVAIAERESPDLLLLDLNMPEMDGYEAIGRLRRLRGLTEMPIVVLTSEEGPGVEQRVLGLGAADYLLKPFNAAVLRARVKAVFHRLAVASAA